MTLFTDKAPGVMRALMGDFPTLGELDAAAIVGNGGHESNGFQTMQERKPLIPGSRGGYGWFQWTGPRRRAFEKWCKARNLSPSSDEANYGFLVHELRTSESHAIPALRRAATLDAKVKAFELAYERAGKKNYAGRIRYAEQALTAFRLTTPKPPKPRPRPPVEPDDPGPDPAITDPPPLGQSTTIWSVIAGFVSSGAAAVLSFIDSPYALVAFIVVVAAGAWIIRERIRHRKEEGV